MTKLIKTIRVEKEFGLSACGIDVDFEVFETSYLYYDTGINEFHRLIFTHVWVKGDDEATCLASRIIRVGEAGRYIIIKKEGDFPLLEDADEALRRNYRC